MTYENLAAGLLARHKFANGIPQEMVSCHTGEIDGYFIEGHVPPADIRIEHLANMLPQVPNLIERHLVAPAIPATAAGVVKD